MNKIAYYIVFLVGIVTCLSFVPHAFLGMKAVNDHINIGEIQEVAATSMQKIWLYSSITMLLSGIWMLFLAKPIKNGDESSRIQAFILGLGLSVFGLGCAHIEGEIDAMFIFTIQGILLILASTIFFKKNHL